MKLHMSNSKEFLGHKINVGKESNQNINFSFYLNANSDVNMPY